MNAAPELLEAAAQGDEQACEQMLRENSGLIWSIVRRYYGRGVEPDDLYQLGCLGFIKAIKGFDFAFGTQFSTYAVPKIAGEIRRFLRDDGAIKVSRSMREQAATIFAAREKLKNTLGREPALSELSEETGFNAEEIAQCELAVTAPDSLQRETGDGLTLEGMLGGESPEFFPVEVNRADYEALLRVPGIGVVSAKRILVARRSGALRAEDLKKLGVVMKRAQYFLTCGGRYASPLKLSQEGILQNLMAVERRALPQAEAQQLSLFDQVG